MPNQNIQLDEIIARLTKVEADAANALQQVYKNNFSSSQIFTKDAVFQTRLNVPTYTTPPATAEVNDIIGIAGVLYICTTAGNVVTPAVFTLVGTQS